MNVTFYKIYYYTFIDSVCNDYTINNKNFIELSNTQNYFILTSGNINGVKYDEYLQNKGIRATFIHSNRNSYPFKFNLFKKYLEKNSEKYQNCIFCKIDTDFIHYKIKKFHDFLNNQFSIDTRYFIGNKKNNWIRGGLNAIHVNSILTCPYLCEDRWNDFDCIFTTTLVQKNIVILNNIPLFDKSYNLSTDKFGTHVVSNDKLTEVLNLNKQLEKINIYEF